MNTDTLDLITKLFSLFSAAISCSAASVAFISSRRSKRNANTALNAQAETDLLYQKFLLEMSEAAKTTTRINNQQISEQKKESLLELLRQWIRARTDDFFTMEDAEGMVSVSEHSASNRDEILQALDILISERFIKEVSGAESNPNRCYHRIKQIYV